MWGFIQNKSSIVIMPPLKVNGFRYFTSKVKFSKVMTFYWVLWQWCMSVFSNMYYCSHLLNNLYICIFLVIVIMSFIVCYNISFITFVLLFVLLFYSVYTLFTDLLRLISYVYHQWQTYRFVYFTFQKKKWLHFILI